MRLTTLITLSVMLILTFSLTEAGDHSVTLDQVYGGYVDVPNPWIVDGAPVVFLLRVASSGEPDCKFSPGMAFRVYSESGATWGTTNLSTGWNYVRIDTLELPGFTIYDTLFFEDQFSETFFGEASVTGSGADTVGFSGIASPGPLGGIYEGLDVVGLTIEIFPTPGQVYNQICLDMVDQMPAFEWQWEGEAIDEEHTCESDAVTPSWGGPYCFEIVNECHGPVTFGEDTPISIQAEHCESMSADFYAYTAHSSNPVDPTSVTYTVISGPGYVSPHFGNWSLGVGGVEDVGVDTLVVQASVKGCWPATHQCEIVRTNQRPMFTAGCDQVAIVGHPNVGQIQFGATDNCPEDSLEFVVIDNGGAIGPVWFDGSVLNFEPDYNDWGRIEVVVGVTDGDLQSNCRAEFALLCPDCGSCCGQYTGGYTGNVNYSEDGLITLGDITALIDHVYISKNPLMCPENGNVNGSMDGMITLGDITALIDHVYVSKQPTAECP